MAQVGMSTESVDDEQCITIGTLLNASVPVAYAHEENIARYPR